MYIYERGVIMTKLFLVLAIAMTVLSSGYTSFPIHLQDGEETPLPPPPPMIVDEGLVDSSHLLDQLKLDGSQADEAPEITSFRKKIDIAVTANQEENPSIAYCGMNQYLAVFVKSDNVYGQRLTSDGALIGTAFQINTGDYYPGRVVGQPDVACEWSHSRYIVVWTYDFSGSFSDLDIHVQGVNNTHQSSGSQLHGDMLIGAADGYNEMTPSIACNRMDANCLVAYAYSGSGYVDILGALILLDSSGLSLADDSFTIGGFAEAETNPDVAWGGTGGYYMVAWEYQRDVTPDPDQWTIIYAIVYDHDQSGTQIKKGGTYLVGYSSLVSNDQKNPAVAYNPREDCFLIVFDYAFSSTDLEIYGKYITGDGELGMGHGNHVIFANSNAKEYEPSIAWSGGAEAFPNSAGGDQYSLAYIKVLPEGDKQIRVLSVIGGYYDYSIGDYITLYELKNLSGWLLGYPGVCGSSDTGRYLTIWQVVDDNTFDVDVYGMMMAPYGGYTPLIRR